MRVLLVLAVAVCAWIVFTVPFTFAGSYWWVVALVEVGALAWVTGREW